MAWCIWVIRKPGLCGIQNFGNTCYISATMQCLFSLPAVQEYLKTCKLLFIMCLPPLRPTLQKCVSPVPISVSPFPSIQPCTNICVPFPFYSALYQYLRPLSLLFGPVPISVSPFPSIQPCTNICVPFPSIQPCTNICVPFPFYSVLYQYLCPLSLLFSPVPISVSPVPSIQGPVRLHQSVPLTLPT